MKVIDVLNQKRKDKKLLFSFEIIPPEMGGNIGAVFKVVDALKKFKPAFIAITSHASKAIYEDQPNGSYKRKITKERPGTFGICAAIKYKYNIEPVAHLCCRGFTKRETEYALIDLDYTGINNLFLVRGDEPGYKGTKEELVNNHTIDLVKQVIDMNNGKYLEKVVDESKKDFGIGVAGYPEKHVEAPNMSTDIKRLKEKIDAGADYIITQMFFNNEKYFAFIAKCRQEDIKVPIIPGLKILTNQNQLESIPGAFYIDIPKEFEYNIKNSKDKKESLETGINWTIKQCKDLIKEGVPYMHFFIMQNAKSVSRVIESLLI